MARFFDPGDASDFDGANFVGVFVPVFAIGTNLPICCFAFGFAGIPDFAGGTIFDIVPGFTAGEVFDVDFFCADPTLVGAAVFATDFPTAGRGGFAGAFGVVNFDVAALAFQPRRFSFPTTEFLVIPNFFPISAVDNPLVNNAFNLPKVVGFHSFVAIYKFLSFICVKF